PVPLTTSGTLSVPSTSYCLTQDVTGNITITANDITLDLNDHAVKGLIIINAGADRAVVRNGKVIVTTPPSTTTAASNGAINILANQAKIFNCTITTPDSTGQDSSGNGLNGMTGIRVGGTNTLIKECFIQTGKGAIGLNSVVFPSTAPGLGGNGGIGIDVESDSSEIIDCRIVTGMGNNGGSGSASSLTGGQGGTGGTGIFITATKPQIIHCIIATNDAGSG